MALSPAPGTPARAERRRARIVAIANQKGGVGKSTTAVSLGAALADLGRKVLVVDLDPQGNASTGLGIKQEARDVTVYDVLANEAAVEDAVVPTLVDGLAAVPSTIDLAGAEIELVSQFSRELRLRRALEPVRDGGYDFVLLDCPPSLGLLTINALAAAEELIVPIQCEYYALEGLGQLLQNVRLVQQNINPDLRLTGIVMTMFDSRTKLSEQVVAEVRRFFGDRVYDTIIPRTVRLSEAPGFGQPITEYDPRSRGAESYRSLAREVADRPIPQGEPLPEYTDIPTVILPASPEEGSVEPEEAPARPVERDLAASSIVPPTRTTTTASVPRAPAPARPQAPPAARETRAPSDRTTAGEPRPTAAPPMPATSAAGATAGGARERTQPSGGRGVSRRDEPRGVDVPLPTSSPASSSPEQEESSDRSSEEDGRRIVVIDERAEEAAVQSGQERPRRRRAVAEAEIGEQLPQEQPRKRRWWQFGKGGDA